MTDAERGEFLKRVTAIHNEVEALEVEFVNLRFFQISKVRANFRERTILLDKAKEELDRYFGVDPDIETPPSALKKQISRFRLLHHKDPA